MLVDFNSRLQVVAITEMTDLPDLPDTTKTALVLSPLESSAGGAESCETFQVKYRQGEGGAAREVRWQGGPGKAHY